MNRVRGGGGAQDGWAGLIGAVATALAGEAPGGGYAPPHPHSWLAAVASATPPCLRQWLNRQAEAAAAAGGHAEPLIYQNELPVQLLAGGIVTAAARAVASWRAAPRDILTHGPATGEPRDGAGDTPDDRVLGIVAISALSTLALEPGGEDKILVQVRELTAGFAAPGWPEALGSLATRTRELHDLLWQARNTRSQHWQHVTLEDRVLAEAAAAAAVGGAAAASGTPPEQWLFPFHLFCRLAVSAAEDALTAIERWLGVDFLPAPRTPQRSASLAVLAASQAAGLWRGCDCKAAAGAGDLAFVPRGRCRQPDHDLRSWRPGQPRPGSRNGSRYASTLWGWLRRWLGGAASGRAGDGERAGYARLHTNDVAGSVLARTWLSTDRGAGGPVLLYDRILPEYCLRCGNKIQLASHTTGAGRTQVVRMCCDDPERVYRSDFTERNGRRLPRPKLGIVVVLRSDTPGRAGYCPTTPLGPLWLCRASGRYSCSRQYCPACGASPGQGHEPVPYGWVLLPHGQAWQDLKDTARPRPGVAGGQVREADLRFLTEIFAELRPGPQPVFADPACVWAAARAFSLADMERFRELAGRRGLELLLRCKEMAGETGRDGRDARHDGARSHGERIGHGDEFVD